MSMYFIQYLILKHCLQSVSSRVILLLSYIMYYFSVMFLFPLFTKCSAIPSYRISTLLLYYQ
jgi:hypothetical protein